ncbi:MAG: UDP-N-acetylmuramoyl-L-alanine--D-glutamate ligase [Betaproteobacteria bacterium]|nr:UDP-N-acetylmuramoyl-L-alanine--D-glutamate ligase [Betaproteobacteria bacterium]
MVNLFNQQQTILVLGLGETGASVLRWLKQYPDLRVIAADTRDNPPHIESLKECFSGISFYCGKEADRAIDRAHIIIASPGIPLSYPPIVEAIKRGAQVMGDVEIFARLVGQSTSKPILIGITGSNGKSTVTTMVGEILKEAGLKTAVVGNIGTPVLDAINEPEAYQAYVIELSSFQLETTDSLYLDAATVLNLSEDHLDRYPGMREYAAAKERIFKHCKARVTNRDDRYSSAMTEQGTLTFGLSAPQISTDWGTQKIDDQLWVYQGSTPYFSVDRFPLAGLHNVANAMAALALTQAVGIDPVAACASLTRFKGLPHRVEFVTRHNDITFYDDSKGTNVGATVAALEGLPQKVVLIAGGEGKGQDFSPLQSALKQHARALVLIGRDAPLIEQATQHSGIPTVFAKDMKEAVVKSLDFALKGDAVLLSPACASFDMFDNYLHRAQVFIRSVEEVIGDSA